MTAYYNENDPHAAQWLRNLIEAGEIAPGYVDERSILDVAPSDLWGFTQCHFFAGVGVWSRALRDAGWPDERPVWTGSCPCQPFSSAGKGAGTDDPRHLWPHFHRLLAACRPPVVMGEQVAGKAGYGWFDGVRADLEGTGYAGRAVDIPALAVNAPHIRQRLYWVATDLENADCRHGKCGQVGQPIEIRSTESGAGPDNYVSGRCSLINMANADDAERRQDSARGNDDHRGQAGWDQDAGHAGACDASDMADAQSRRNMRSNEQTGVFSKLTQCGQGYRSFWSDHIWLTGSDGKSRRSKPGLPLLANGVSGGLALVRTRKDGAEETHTYNRVGALRAFGNAIVAPLAKEVIIALMEVLDDGKQSLQENR